MECCVYLNHDKLRGMYLGFQQGLKVRSESKSIQGLVQATHLSYASLSSLTLSSHLITAPAGVTAVSPLILMLRHILLWIKADKQMQDASGCL